MTRGVWWLQNRFAARLRACSNPVRPILWCRNGAASAREQGFQPENEHLYSGQTGYIYFFGNL